MLCNAAKLWVVALRKESVDRNGLIFFQVRIVTRSLSARRAWIEIPGLHRLAQNLRVALRKESVDRNECVNGDGPRRSEVALRKESVDRNCFVSSSAFCSHWSLSARRAWIEIITIIELDKRYFRRSPQGERG